MTSPLSRRFQPSTYDAGLRPKYGAPPPSNIRALDGWRVSLLPLMDLQVSLYRIGQEIPFAQLHAGDEIPWPYYDVDEDMNLVLLCNVLIEQPPWGVVFVPASIVTIPFVEVTRPNDGQNYPLIAPPVKFPANLLRCNGGPPPGYVFHVFANTFVPA